MNQSASWWALLSVGLPMFLSILISTISVKNQDNLVAFRKGASTTQPAAMGNAPKTLLAAC
jgi:hypothetical protein